MNFAFSSQSEILLIAISMEKPFLQLRETKIRQYIKCKMIHFSFVLENSGCVICNQGKPKLTNYLSHLSQTDQPDQNSILQDYCPIIILDLFPLYWTFFYSSIGMLAGEKCPVIISFGCI